MNKWRTFLFFLAIFPTFVLAYGGTDEDPIAVKERYVLTPDQREAAYRASNLIIESQKDDARLRENHFSMLDRRMEKAGYQRVYYGIDFYTWNNAYFFMNEYGQPIPLFLHAQKQVHFGTADGPVYPRFTKAIDEVIEGPKRRVIAEREAREQALAEIEV